MSDETKYTASRAIVSASSHLAEPAPGADQDGWTRAGLLWLTLPHCLRGHKDCLIGLSEPASGFGGGLPNGYLSSPLTAPPPPRLHVPSPFDRVSVSIHVDKAVLIGCSPFPD